MDIKKVDLFYTSDYFEFFVTFADGTKYTFHGNPPDGKLTFASAEGNRNSENDTAAQAELRKWSETNAAAMSAVKAQAGIRPAFCPSCVSHEQMTLVRVEPVDLEDEVANDGSGRHTHDERNRMGVFSCKQGHSFSFKVTNCCWCGWQQATAP